MPRRSIHFTTPVDADPALHRSEEEPLPPYPSDESKRATNAPPSALAGTDLSEFFGPAGPLAQALEGYELRQSQLQMAEAVKRAILGQRHALIEAPTGTGKSIAYLAPAILSGKTVVISTANKSLQSQLFQKEIPFLRKVLNRPISAVIVKGRSNFICTLKWEKESKEQRYISLYDRMDEQFRFVEQWLEETETGDIDDLPFVLNNDLRTRIVSFPDDCLHNDCRHYEDNCWVNRMRDEAAQAQVIITNHHLLLNALGLGYAGERILPPASIYVIDEAHHLEQIATAVFEVMVTDYTVEQLLGRAIFKEHIGDDEIERLRHLNALAFQEISQRSRDNSFELTGDLEAALSLSAALSELGQRLKRANPYAAAVEQAAKLGERPDPETAERHRSYELTVTAIHSAAESLKAIGGSRKDGAVVRYAVRVFDRRHVTLEVHAAPIHPADLLSAYLFHPEDEDGEAVGRTVICTSATLATAGGFHHYKARCGIREVGEELILPAVFDYPRQALLYQPALPAYDYRNADAYYDAVAAEIERLLEVSRGRALCLFTSWSGLQQVSDRLQAERAGVVWPLRAQGDAPREALLSWFKTTPYSVLLATRSFWEGVDIPGEELSLVVLDKLPFPTPGDPLHAARMRALEEQGRSSFDEYMIPLMTLALKQGFGRLIRRSDDCGVVAILDERLTSKAYGRRSRQDLPPARFTREFKDVHRFYSQALRSPAEFALNVWSVGDDAQGWRWQLVRLFDGRAETRSGRAEAATPEQAEMHAALDGLQDLQRRIRRAGQDCSRYTVELRCSRGAAQWLAEAPVQDELYGRWTQVASVWQAVLPRVVRGD